MVCLFICFNDNPRINCCNLYVAEPWDMCFQIFHVLLQLYLFKNSVYWDNWYLKKPCKNPFGKKRELLVCILFSPIVGQIVCSGHLCLLWHLGNINYPFFIITSAYHHQICLSCIEYLKKEFLGHVLIEWIICYSFWIWGRNNLTLATNTRDIWLSHSFISPYQEGSIISWLFL